MEHLERKRKKSLNCEENGLVGSKLVFLQGLSTLWCSLLMILISFLSTWSRSLSFQSSIPRMANTMNSVQDTGCNGLLKVEGSPEYLA